MLSPFAWSQGFLSKPTIWKQCVHRPMMIGQSSPGYLHLAQVPSKLTRQMPQVSSELSGRSHFQAATALKELMVIFMISSGSLDTGVEQHWLRPRAYSVSVLFCRLPSGLEVVVYSKDSRIFTSETLPPLGRAERWGMLHNRVSGAIFFGFCVLVPEAGKRKGKRDKTINHGHVAQEASIEYQVSL